MTCCYLMMTFCHQVPDQELFSYRYFRPWPCSSLYLAPSSIGKTSPNHSKHNALQRVTHYARLKSASKQTCPSICGQYHANGFSISDGMFRTKRLLGRLDDSDRVDEGIAHDAGQKANGGTAKQVPSKYRSEPRIRFQHVIGPILSKGANGKMEQSIKGSTSREGL